VREFETADIDRMLELRSKGTSIRSVAKDFHTSQWMIAKLMIAQASVMN
jgi:hypothetical protein